MRSGKIKTVLWILGMVIVGILGLFLYQLATAESGNGLIIVLMLLLGLVLGGVIAFLASG